MDVFERLADALDRLPNGYPRTRSGVELRILQRIFSQEEASLAAELSGEWEAFDQIEKRLGLQAELFRSLIFPMVRRGMVWLDKREGRVWLRLAPFIVGIYEAQVELMDHELAHLVEQYLLEGGAAGIMKPEPALHRVVPAHAAIKSEWILPYDDVRAILLNATTFHLRDCICRKEQDFVGRKCDFPLNVCLSFGNGTPGKHPGEISRELALALLDETERLGLVHTVSNVMEGLSYVCNCCGCCCGILRGVTEWGMESSVAHANYLSHIDEDLCNACGICEERCQVHAITTGEIYAQVNEEKCIGCGLCVTGCPNNAARLERKPDSQLIHPPSDYASWESERLRLRGLHPH
jgi:NAD-dependent dihydropyrimidine dehydrogenase PreA subunit